MATSWPKNSSSDVHTFSRVDLPESQKRQVVVRGFQGYPGWWVGWSVVVAGVVAWLSWLVSGGLAVLAGGWWPGCPCCWGGCPGCWGGCPGCGPGCGPGWFQVLRGSRHSSGFQVTAGSAPGRWSQVPHTRTTWPHRTHYPGTHHPLPGPTMTHVSPAMPPKHC